MHDCKKRHVKCSIQLSELCLLQTKIDDKSVVQLKRKLETPPHFFLLLEKVNTVFLLETRNSLLLQRKWLKNADKDIQ